MAFTNKNGFCSKALTEREREKNRSKSSVRAKASYRGLMKNGNRLFVAAAQANLFMARHHLMRLPQERCAR